MNERQRAVAILTDVRDTLAARLSERVVENAEQLLEDADGDSFRGEIEQLYEQLGSKLCLVNQMLSNIPPANEEDFGGDDVEFDVVSPENAGHSEDDSSRIDRGTATGLSVESSANGEPVAQTETQPQSVKGQPFDPYLDLVLANRIDAAANMLSELFDLPRARALECTRQFAENAALEDHDLVALAERMTGPSDADHANWSHAILKDRFGLTEGEAETAWRRLCRRAVNNLEPITQ